MVSLDDVAWPLRTRRLSIRRTTPVDAEATWRYRSRPDVAEWLPRLAADLPSWADFFSAEERLERTLVVEFGGAVVGDLYLHVRDGWAQAEVSAQASGCEAEIGWVLAPEHQGRGLATEAAGALLELCFAELGVRRVVAGCFADNEPSWRLMERLGMRRESHAVRESLHRTRGWLDGCTYALLAEEWATRSPAAGRRTSSR